MKNLGLPEAYVVDKQPRGVLKARCDALQSSFREDDEGNVIRKKRSHIRFSLVKTKEKRMLLAS